MDQLLEVGAEESWRVINDYGFYLDICHFSIALMGAKKKLGSTAREKPLISAGVSVFACFLSGFTLNFLCGFPILGSLQATTTLYLIAVLWIRASNRALVRRWRARRQVSAGGRSVGESLADKALVSGRSNLFFKSNHFFS